MVRCTEHRIVLKWQKSICNVNSPEPCKTSQPQSHYLIINKFNIEIENDVNRMTIILVVERTEEIRAEVDLNRI